MARTTVVDMDVFEAAMADGRPVLFLPPHLGCFEIMAQWYGATQASRYGRPMTVLYRVPRKPVLRQIVAQGREREGLVLAPADMNGVRKLMRAMKKREVVGILPDQVPSQGEGVWAPFFGRPAYTMTLPTRLAHQFDGLIVFVWGQRLAAGAGWRLHARRLDDRLTGDPLEDATRMNRGLERLIRDKPDQYLWGYKRYKVPAGVEPPGRQP
jgi:KDO2-lipid IV(A) lauroyltransferase